MTLALIIAAAFFLPQTSSETLREFPLAPGEMAWENYGNRTSAYIGSDDGRPLPVTDPFTLHGSKTGYVPVDRFQVYPGPGWTRSGGVMSVTLTEAFSNAYVSVAVQPGYAEPEVLIEEESENASGGIGEGFFAKKVERSGNRINITYSYRSVDTKVTLSDFKVRYFIGGSDEVNDLSDLRIRVKDRIGTYDMNNLRHWTKNLYNGNRGEDWSTYLPKSNVYMDKRVLAFGADKVIGSAKTGETNHYWSVTTNFPGTSRQQIVTNHVICACGTNYYPDVATMSANVIRDRELTVSYNSRDVAGFGIGGEPYVSNGTERIEFLANPKELTRTEWETALPHDICHTYGIGIIQLQFKAVGFTAFDISKCRLFVTVKYGNDDFTWREVPYDVIPWNGTPDGRYVIQCNKLSEESSFYRLEYDTVYTVFTVYGTLRARGPLDFGQRSFADFGITNRYDAADPDFASAVRSVGLGLPQETLTALAEIAEVPLPATAGTVAGAVALVIAALRKLKSGKQDKLTGIADVKVVTELPANPDANTLYIIKEA